MTRTNAPSEIAHTAEREGQRPSPRTDGTGDPKAEGPLLEMSNLSVRIGGHPVLHGIDLSVTSGEILALTGESGSGKSMTALAAMGLLPAGAAASGSIRLAGQDLLALDEPALCRIRGARIGMVFQEPMTALDPVMTIGAQVAETIRIHAPQTPRAEAMDRARATLARVGLSEDAVPATRYPHELSGGQRQRVVIAIAIAMRPALLIADEPTTALDVTTQARILDLLRRLVREDGMAMMLITHDLGVVAGLADRIAVMQHGRIIETARPAALLSAPRHPYSRALIDAARPVRHAPGRQPGPVLLRVEDVHRTYPLPRRTLFGPRPLHHAVRGVSFDIRRGERVGLVGESGCGKSTLTRAILGLEPVQAGTIALDGDTVTPDAPGSLRRRLQVVFQDPYGSFNPRHRTARLVAEPFHLLPDAPTGSDRDDAVAEALRAVGLDPGAARRHIHAFSGGQRQRIAIARALITRPDLVIFDEAVSALDVSVRGRILALIADLSQELGLAYLFISHDLEVVRAVTDRVLVMQAGRIVEEGATEAVLGEPRHPYTRALIAAAPRLPDLERAAPKGAQA